MSLKPSNPKVLAKRIRLDGWTSGLAAIVATVSSAMSFGWSRAYRAFFWSFRLSPACRADISARNASYVSAAAVISHPGVVEREFYFLEGTERKGPSDGKMGFTRIMECAFYKK